MASRYGRSDVDETLVVEAAKAANAHGFIVALANGYDTLVGELESAKNFTRRK